MKNALKSVRISKCFSPTMIFNVLALVLFLNNSAGDLPRLRDNNDEFIAMPFFYMQQGVDGNQTTAGIDGNQTTAGVDGNQTTAGVDGNQTTAGVNGNQTTEGVNGNQTTEGTGVDGNQTTEGPDGGDNYTEISTVVFTNGTLNVTVEKHFFANYTAAPTTNALCAGVVAQIFTTFLFFTTVVYTLAWKEDQRDSAYGKVEKTSEEDEDKKSDESEKRSSHGHRRSSSRRRRRSSRRSSHHDDDDDDEDDDEERTKTHKSSKVTFDDEENPQSSKIKGKTRDFPQPPIQSQWDYQGSKQPQTFPDVYPNFPGPQQPQSPSSNIFHDSLGKRFEVDHQGRVYDDQGLFDEFGQPRYERDDAQFDDRVRFDDQFDDHFDNDDDDDQFIPRYDDDEFLFSEDERQLSDEHRHRKRDYLSPDDDRRSQRYRDRESTEEESPREHFDDRLTDESLSDVNEGSKSRQRRTSSPTESSSQSSSSITEESS